MTESPSPARPKARPRLSIARPGALGLSLLLHSVAVAAGVIYGPVFSSELRPLPIQAANWQSPEESPEIETPEEPPQEIREVEKLEPELADPEEQPLAEKELPFDFEPLEAEPEEPRERPMEHWLSQLLPKKKPVDPEPREAVAKPAPEEPAPAPAKAEPEPIVGKNPSPRYPKRAIQLQLQGVAEIRVDVDADGHVTKAVLVRSTGAQILDREALRTVRGWRFEGGPGSTIVEIEFRLTDREQ